MSSVHLVEAPLEISFDKVDGNSPEFEREYNTICENDDDAIGQWLRVAKAKGETGDSDPVVLHLIVELYRKIDRLEQIITNSAPKRLSLSHKGGVARIGFEHFEMSEPLFQEGERYYGRLELPLHNRKEVPLYFEAVSPTLGKIFKMHSRDENEWSAYRMARERMMIRQLKGNE